MGVPILPLEILWRIMDVSCPDAPRAILVPWDRTTATLLAFTRVCRGTHRHASRLLRRHCVYIDCGWRAKALARSLSLSNSSEDCEWGLADPGLRHIESMFLAPFPKLAKDLDPDQQRIQQQYLDVWFTSKRDQSVNLDDANHDDDDDDDAASARSSSPSERSVDSEWDTLSPIEDYAIADSVRKILKSALPSLKKLVIDMDLRSLRPENDPLGIKAVLRDGFHTASSLEEFVSVRDELYLSLESPSVESELEFMATCWRHLRHLSLYNVCLTADIPFWRHLAMLPSLELAVLPRSDPFDRWNDDRKTWMKVKWVESNAEAKGQSYHEARLDVRPVTLVHVNMGHLVRDDSSRPSTPELDPDPDNRIRIGEVWLDEFGNKTLDGEPLLPPDTTNSTWSFDFDPIEGCQDWVLQQSLNGTLWDNLDD